MHCLSIRQNSTNLPVAEWKGDHHRLALLADAKFDIGELCDGVSPRRAPVVWSQLGSGDGGDFGLIPTQARVASSKSWLGVTGGLVSFSWFRTCDRRVRRPSDGPFLLFSHEVRESKMGIKGVVDPAQFQHRRLLSSSQQENSRSLRPSLNTNRLKLVPRTSRSSQAHSS